MATKNYISVFIASPSDLAIERAAFKKVIDELNKGFGDGMNIEFESLGWEDTLATTGRRSQSVINQEIDRCHVFILCLHRRWGQDAPDTAYSSYTEEEFHRALERWKETDAPEIFVFFKRVDAGQEADPGPQLENVMNFRRQLEETRQVIYRNFNNEDEFRQEIDTHLRAFARGELPKVEKESISVLPITAIKEIDAAKKQAEESLREAKQANERAVEAHFRAELLQIEFAEEATNLALEGKLETARQKFAKAINGTTSLRILQLAFEFYYRTGELALAEELVRTGLAITGEDNKTAATANQYGNLGTIYRIRGDLDKAEEFYLKSVDINESLGRKEGMAKAYGNLGNTYLIRGDLDKAEEFHLKSLDIEESLGRKEGMASDYGNLGNTYRIRGDLGKAEEFYLKSLGIEESLGRKEGMANAYGSLGTIYQTRGDLDKAEEFHLKSLDINESLGRKDGMASVYSNLGTVYQTRGDLDKAEEFYLKSLDIDESLGGKEGVASVYSNLGAIYRTRGDLDKAEELWRKSLGYSTDIGATLMIERVQSLIDSLKE